MAKWKFLNGNGKITDINTGREAMSKGQFNYILGPSYGTNKRVYVRENCDKTVYEQLKSKCIWGGWDKSISLETFNCYGGLDQLHGFEFRSDTLRGIKLYLLANGFTEVTSLNQFE